MNARIDWERLEHHEKTTEADRRSNCWRIFYQRGKQHGPIFDCAKREARLNKSKLTNARNMVLHASMVAIST